MLAAHDHVDMRGTFALFPDPAALGAHRLVVTVAGLFALGLAFVHHFADQAPVLLFVGVHPTAALPVLVAVRDVANAFALNLVGAVFIVGMRHWQSS
jgi:hypothetical protein